MFSPATKLGQSASKWHLGGLASRVKSLVVSLALWGLIPYRVAEWLIRWGGLRNV